MQNVKMVFKTYNYSQYLIKAVGHTNCHFYRDTSQENQRAIQGNSPYRRDGRSIHVLAGGPHL